VKRLTGPLIGALAGAIAFELSYGFELADPQRIGWLMNANDPSIHFLGWHLFRHGPWTVPLGATTGLQYPVGTSVALTDSIPIMATLFRVVDPLLPRDFQYIGLWILSCFVLQGVFGAALASTVTASASLQALAAMLFVLAPAMLHRFALGHVALGAHWIVLAMLWVYFSDRADQLPHRRFTKVVVIAAIAASTHAYVAFMVFVIVVAIYGRLALASPSRAVKSVLAPFLLIAAVTAAVFWQSGYLLLAGNEDLKGGGFGWHSMNLLASLMPMGTSTLLRREPFIVATNGQYEGYAYLGAGLLVLAVVCAGSLCRRDRLVPSKQLDLVHWPLVAACIVLTVFAASPRVTAASKTLFEYPVTLWGPLTVFRASGRMFWPVYYALIFALIATAIRRFPTRYAILLLSLSVVLQAIDSGDSYRVVRLVRDQQWEESLRSEFWRVVPPQYQHISLIPTNLCPASVPPVNYREFALAAGRSGITINAGHAARENAAAIKAYCAEFSTQFADGAFSESDLYVVQREVIPRLLQNARVPMVCTVVDAHGVCFVRTTYQRWQRDFNLTEQAMPPLEDLIAFRATLESEYGERMHRPPTRIAGDLRQRVTLIAHYIAYRRSGCTDAEATTKVLEPPAARSPKYLCDSHSPEPGAFPDFREVMLFIGRLPVLAPSSAVDANAVTHLDVEGEAVWMTEYAKLRVAGHTSEQASVAVLSTIREIAGT
jgi:Family of unknown function (DUF6311)